MATVGEIEYQRGAEPGGIADVGMTVVGGGAPEFDPVAAATPMRLASAKVPSVETAGSLLPPETAPPVAPGEAGPPEAQQPGLMAGWQEITRQLNETDARRRQLAEAERAYQEQGMADARARLEASQGRYGAEAQNVLALLERQAATRPKPPAVPVEPPVPQPRIRIFGEGPENQSGMQAAQGIISSLGLMAQMGMGLKSGYNRGAAAAFAGAMKGWVDGNMIAAQQQWQEYLANVQKMQREWQRDRQAYDDILREEGGDVERAKLKLAIRQSEAGYDKSLVDLTLRDLEQSFKFFKVQDDAVQDLTKNTMGVMTNMLLADQRERFHLDTVQNQQQQRMMDAMRLRLDEVRAAQTAEHQRQQERQAAAGLAQQAWYQREQIALGNRRVDEQQAKVGAVQQQLNAAVSQAGAAVKSIQKMLADPEQKKVVEQYLGPLEQYRLGYERNAPWRGELPKEAVALDQELSTIQANLKFLLAGKTMTGIEAASVMGMLPQLSDRPDAFAQKLEGTKRNIALLEKKPAKVEGARVINVQGADGKVRPFQLDPGETEANIPAGYKVVR